MSQIYAVVGPITTAVRLSNELARHGITSTVVHTPNANGGCSYSVLTDKSGKKLLAGLSERYKIKRIFEADSDA